MPPPELDSIVELEHCGNPFRAIVEKVDPDPASTLFSLVTLVLATDAPRLEPRDMVDWISPRGPGVTVHQALAGVVPRIVLGWIGD
jgi:hypothetical protein